MTPESRRAQLLAQPVGDELVIYDERTNAAHRLNATAAHVWRLADGERSLQDLAAALGESLEPHDPAVLGDASASEELVRLALTELDRAGLLVRGLPALGEPMTRREMMVVAAALVPVVASIVAPTPAMAQTPPQAFTVSVKGSFQHLGPGSSQTRADGATSPPQPAGTYTITWTGPGIVGSNQRSGVLDANGQFTDTQAINSFGTYTATVTVTSGGSTVTSSTQVTVE